MLRNGTCNREVLESDGSLLPANSVADARWAADLSLVVEVVNLDRAPTVTGGEHMTVHLTDERHYGITLLLATGAETHLNRLRELAAERGMNLGPSGLKRGRKL